jgi:hypothetical protein
MSEKEDNLNNILKLANIYHISFETELCETLDWDQEETNKQLEKLHSYLKVCTKTDPSLIRGDISLIFPEKVSSVINKYLILAEELIEKEEQNEV